MNATGDIAYSVWTLNVRLKKFAEEGLYFTNAMAAEVFEELRGYRVR